MQLLNKFNNEFVFYCVLIDIYSNYALVIPLNDKKRYYNYYCFSKIMVHNDLEGNNIKMYSAHKEEKSAVPEKLIRTLKSEIYKYMTWIFIDVYQDKLDDIFNKYHNTYHSTIKLNLFYVKLSTYSDFY